VLDYAGAVSKTLAKEVELKISGEYRRGDNRHSVSSVEKLKKLGWAPKRSLDKILQDFYQWVLSIGGIPDQIPNAYAEMKDAGVIVQAAVPAD
jgi:dTDP-L-rhamnose 4-epimerase